MRVKQGEWPAHKIEAIFLDGVQQRFVLMADEEAGEIERVAVDENGKPKRGEEEFVRETVRGRVEIRLKK